MRLYYILVATLKERYHNPELETIEAIYGKRCLCRSLQQHQQQCQMQKHCDYFHIENDTLL